MALRGVAGAAGYFPQAGAHGAGTRGLGQGVGGYTGGAVYYPRPEGTYSRGYGGFQEAMAAHGHFQASSPATSRSSAFVPTATSSRMEQQYGMHGGTMYFNQGYNNQASYTDQHGRMPLRGEPAWQAPATVTVRPMQSAGSAGTAPRTETPDRAARAAPAVTQLPAARRASFEEVKSPCAPEAPRTAPPMAQSGMASNRGLLGAAPSAVHNFASKGLLGPAPGAIKLASSKTAAANVRTANATRSRQRHVAQDENSGIPPTPKSAYKRKKKSSMYSVSVIATRMSRSKAPASH